HYMCTALESLVKALETAPQTPMRMLAVLPEAERRQLLYEWNDTRVDYPGDKCMHELFEERVEEAPDAVAVVFEEEELSYAELNRRANQLAHYLRQLGVQPDARVAICVERGLEMIVALLAVLKAGGAYVPLDPAYPAERLQFMLDDSAPTVLLTQTHLKGLFSGICDPLPVLDLSAQTPPWHTLPETNPALGTIGLTSCHLAYIIYTSGSTGQPKGVAVEHRSLTNYLFWIIDLLATEAIDCLPALTNLTFDASLKQIFGPLITRKA